MAELYLFKDNNTYYGFKPSILSLGSTTFEGREFVPAILSRSAIEITDNLAKSVITIRFERTHTFARRMLNEFPEVPVLVTIYRNSLPYWKGRIVKPKANGIYIELHCDSDFASQSKTGANPLISPQCWHVLYSPQCGVIEALFASPYSVSNVSTKVITVAGLSEEDGYFNNGKAIINGQTRHIVSNVGTTITLAYAFDGVVSGILNLYPGCDLTEETCKNIFHNLENHIGFSRLTEKNPFSSTGLL